MELKQLTYFVRVAELGSFVKAAELLSIGQPTLSRQIRALEIELKANLFHRNGRGVLLTANGALFLERARGVLASANAATEVVRQGDRRLTGKVVCGVSQSVGKTIIPEFVRRFGKALPHASLSIVSHLSTTLHDQMRASRLDFAISYGLPVAPLLNVTQLSAEPLYLISAKPVGRSAHTVTLAEIDNLALIVPSRLHAIRNPFELEAVRLGITLKIALEIDLMEPLLEIVAEGKFHGVATRFGFLGYAAGVHLCKQRIVEPEIYTSVALMSPPTSALTALQRAAIDLAQSTYLDLMPGIDIPAPGRELAEATHL